MNEENKHEDIHITKGLTRWVHHHRRLAVWIMKLLIAGVASFLYYLRSQEKEIEQEQKNKK